MPRRNRNAATNLPPTGKRTNRFGFTNICQSCGADPMHFTHRNTNACPYSTNTTNEGQ